MVIVLVIAILTSLCLIASVLFFPKLKIGKVEINTYWIVCIVGALLMIIFRQISFKQVGHSLIENNSINPLKILILFFSMTLLSIFLDEIGFFKYLATKAAKIAKTSQHELFIILYILTSILTIFTSNDIVILTFTPFICYFCKHANIKATPYLVAEFAAANTWSMMLIIGNPTNIYLATSANITFIEYFKVMAIPTLIAGLVEIIVLFIIFNKQLKQPIETSEETTKIDDRIGLIIGLIHLAVCLILLVISSYIHLAMWLISLCCALSLLIMLTISNLIQRKSFKHLLLSIKRLPYELIPFMISMFVIVASLKNQGVSKYLTNLLESKNNIFTYGYASFIGANLINNIPMSVLFSTLPTIGSHLNQVRAIYATIVGSNIGAFLTPIGALAGIMFTQLLAKQHVKYGFKTFVKYGLMVSIPTITTALLVLFFIL